MNALDRLEAGVAWGCRFLEPVRIGGRVTEVAMSHYRVAGLSRFLKLGECVSLDVGGRAQIGPTAFRAENLSLSPHPSWKGRVIDALGRPIDTNEPLEQGDRAMPLDA